MTSPTTTATTPTTTATTPTTATRTTTATIPITAAKRWFLTPKPLPDADYQLFCLSYAGGGAPVYRSWPAALGERIEIDAAVLPGRPGRGAEPPEVDPDALAAAIADRADRPFALYGHSMGALLGFEVVRALRRRGERLPERLFVGGHAAPDTSRAGDVYDGLSFLDDDGLLDRLVAAGGLPAAVLGERELLELLLPVFRADFGWLDGYAYTPEPALPVPVTAFAGVDDPSAPPRVMREWARHTSAEFALHALPGGHFFLDEQLPALSTLIRAGLPARPRR
jgi:surfactin synthase thioesterase subunit